VGTKSHNKYDVTLSTETVCLESGNLNVGTRYERDLNMSLLTCDDFFFLLVFFSS